MDADTLQVLVSDYVVDRAATLGLDPDTLVVEFVLNWGGFVNYSYRIHDAQHAYHLKLSTSADNRSALRRWMTFAPLLEPYHAPPVLEWIDLGAAAGPLFPFIEGHAPALDDHVLAELVPVLSQLNADRELAAALRPSHPSTARDAYLASFHQRFMEDLQGIRTSRPPFVEEALLPWLDDQTAYLSELIRSCSAFDQPLTKPVHGDLWLNNVLWTSRHEWSLVDWDEMRIGDPAADLAALLGPSAQDLRPLKMMDRIDGLITSTEHERLRHLGRATLLDWIIDPLSDWIDAYAAPEHAQAVRTEKERVHKRALTCYRELYG